jgi:hypothetical protein
VRIRVWVDAWQMQCCGVPFAVGQEISWQLSQDVDTEWLTSVLGTDAAEAIRFSYEHHGRLPEDAPHTRGTVLQIKAAHSRYAPAAGENARTLHPVPGSGQLATVDSADGWDTVALNRHFNGYLVDLDVTDAGIDWAHR